jgi:hypothetical protein
VNQGVGLGDAREVFASAPGQLVGIVRHTLDSFAGEHARGNRHAAVEVFVDEPADLDKFAFGVLTDDHEVNVAGRLVSQRTFDPVQQARRPIVHVLVEALAHLEGEQPGGQRVVDVGQPHGPEVDRFKILENVQTVVRKERPGLLVVARSIGEFFRRNPEPESLRRRIQHADARRDDFVADPITRNHGDSVLTCHILQSWLK